MMPDREKVIKAYENFINEYECFCTSDDIEYEMHKAVLALLKEQGEEIENLRQTCQSMKEEGNCAVIDNWADLCPICEYPFELCQCRFGGSAHPNRSDRARVVFDHLYLLTARQLDHVVNIQSFWQTSYANKKQIKILLDLMHKAKGDTVPEICTALMGSERKDGKVNEEGVSVLRPLWESGSNFTI